MVLAETTDGQDTIYYLHGLDLVAQSDGTNTEYFTYDALGSVRQMVDDAANPLLTQTYDPYGTVYASVGVGASSYGYTNEYTDATGLLYLRARYYSPSMGRFLNVDPSRQERNLYEYAISNPVMFTDPSGLDPLDAAWHNEFQRVHQRTPEAADYLIRLFSIAFPDEWEWSTFYNDDGTLRVSDGETYDGAIIFHDTNRRSWADMDDALIRLALMYHPTSEKYAFVRDVGTLFGGLLNRFEEPSITSAVIDPRNPVREWVAVGPGGLDPELIGTDWDNNVHHFGWAFVLGFEFGPGGIGLNTERELRQYANSCDTIDFDDLPRLALLGYALTNEDAAADIWFGNRAAQMGSDVAVFGVSPDVILWLWHRDILKELY